MAGLLSHTLGAHDEDCAVDCGTQVRSPGVDHRERHCERGASGQASVKLAVGKPNLPEGLTCINLLRPLKQYSNHQELAHQPDKLVFICR